MLHWLPLAMVRVAAFFIAGILLGIYFPNALLQRDAIWLLGGMAVLYLSVCLLFRRAKSLAWLSGITGLATIFLCGYVHLNNRSESLDPEHFLHRGSSIRWYSGTITNDPEERRKSFRIELAVDLIWISDHPIPSFGKVLLYFPKDTVNRNLRYGDRLLIRGCPEFVPPPGNPGEFDFREYLRRKNIFHQQYVGAGQYAMLNHDDRPGVLALAFKWRRTAVAVIDRFVSGERERGITKALVLGVTDGIDNELLDAYSATGAMHILSVSGLHVGIIYGVIAFLLKPLGQRKRGRWIVAILSLLSLWSYALVTGLSASVLRSVSMFSFVVIARPIGRETNIFNTLAASGFLLLCYDPWLILSVGFQLSYIAVFGIIYLQQKLYDWWEPESWLMDKIWQITSVSIAAQLATFALGLFYFHQFPNYFLVSNLVVIPLSSLVLLMGIFLLMVSSIPVIAVFTGLMLNYLIQWLNGAVLMMESWPWSRIEGVQISLAQCLLLIGLVMGIVLFIEQRRLWIAWACIALIGLFVLDQFVTDSQNFRRREWIVHRIPGQGAMSWIDGENATLMADSIVVGDERYKRNVHPCFLIKGVQVVKSLPAPRQDSSLVRLTHEGLRVIWIRSRNYRLLKHASADFVVLGNSSLRSLDSLLSMVSFDKLILDGSNSPGFRKRIALEAAVSHISCHSVTEDGAFVLNLTP